MNCNIIFYLNKNINPVYISIRRNQKLVELSIYCQKVYRSLVKAKMSIHVNRGRKIGQYKVTLEQHKR